MAGQFDLLILSKKKAVYDGSSGSGQVKDCSFQLVTQYNLFHVTWRGDGYCLIICLRLQKLSRDERAQDLDGDHWETVNNISNLRFVFIQLFCYRKNTTQVQFLTWIQTLPSPRLVAVSRQKSPVFLIIYL